MIVLLVHLSSTLYMTGLIWFVQIVHYPLFAMVDSQSFAPYHDAHTRLTAWAVGMPMVVEAATALVLLKRRPRGPSFELVGASSVTLAMVWASTWLLQVPQHRILASGFNDTVHSFLVDSNWTRTCGWTLRSLLVLAIVAKAALRSNKSIDVIT